MIKNYNGSINRSMLRDLKRLCEVNEENRKTLIEAFEEKGEVSFYTNLDPFTGCPDEMSDVKTLKSEEEINGYLKNDFKERIEVYLSSKMYKEDYLLDTVINFIKENGGTYPTREEMEKLEKASETRRVASLPQNEDENSNVDMNQMVLKEILILAEEIFEARNESNPKDIVVHVEPYQDDLRLENDNFYMVINWDRHYGVGNSCDYSCTVQLKEWDYNVDIICFYNSSSGTAFVNGKNFRNEDIEFEKFKSHISTIHKGICEMAKKEGIKFKSEVDYTKLS